jgi:hypothetical protein
VGKCCVECTADKPKAIAYTRGWITLSYPSGAGECEATFCSWECLQHYTVGCVLGEGYMLGTKESDRQR